MNKKNILYIDVLKIIACFFVVVNHTGGTILNYSGKFIIPFYCLNFSICKIGVAIFIMITGILILNKQFNFKQVLQFILRVIVPMIVLTFVFYVKNSGINNISIIEFLKSIISEPYIIPYWYIYMLIFLYIATPFLQKMIKNFEQQDFILFTVFFVLIPSIADILQIYTDIKISNYLFWASFPMVIGIYITGNYISRININKKYFLISALLFIIALIGMFLSMFIPYIHDGEVSHALDNYSALPVIIMACSLVYIIRYLCEKYNLKDKKNIIHIIASTTFGIYLIHYETIYIFYKQGIMQNIFNISPYLGIIVLELLIFIICSILIFLIKKIPLVNKFL